MTKIVLIITVSTDTHADKVCGIINGHRHTVIRINSDQLSASQQIIFDPNKSDPIIVHSNNKDYTLSQIDSIWLRKPLLTQTYINKSKKEYFIDDFKKEEFKVMFTALLLSACQRGIFILNYNDHIQYSRSKIIQLIAAKNIDFKIPDTIESCNLTSLSTFIREHNNCAVLKKLGTSVDRIGNKIVPFFTTEITLKQFSQYYKNKVIDYPIFLQEKIDKLIELRITIVGNKLFGCTIDSQAFKGSKIDSRSISPFKMTHKIIQLPLDLKNKCFELCRKFDLNYGAIDMAITSSGEYVFFEINPNGQYLWIEEITGAPISEAIANLLINPGKNRLK